MDPRSISMAKASAISDGGIASNVKHEVTFDYNPKDSLPEDLIKLADEYKELDDDNMRSKHLYALSGLAARLESLISP